MKDAFAALAAAVLERPAAWRGLLTVCTLAVFLATGALALLLWHHYEIEATWKDNGSFRLAPAQPAPARP
ncbi:MAG: hypothetical protein Q8P41_06845, partial [Pseudomonadota bacterium]|nr:hypothetical protein [Pseudomonadota bacterium]